MKIWIGLILGLIGLMGVLERGWFDVLGLGTLAMLVIPIVVAMKRGM